MKLQELRKIIREEIRTEGLFSKKKPKQPEEDSKSWGRELQPSQEYRDLKDSLSPEDQKRIIEICRFFDAALTNLERDEKRSLYYLSLYKSTSPLYFEDKDLKRLLSLKVRSFHINPDKSDEIDVILKF